MDMRARIKEGLTQRGMAPHVADAFIMNFQSESNLNPGINEAAPTVPGSRGGYGLAQWTGPRRRQLEAYAGTTGKPVSDVDVQLDFLMSELQGSERKAGQSIMGAKDTGSAAAAIVNKFLRPAEQHRARRVAEYTGGGSTDTLLGGLSLAPDRMGAAPILDTMEAPQMEPQKATGILGKLFGDMTEERADGIRLGVNGMLHNPNRGLERKVQGRMDDRRQDGRDQKAQQSAAQQANKMAAWLATQPGGKDVAEAIASGALSGIQGLQMWQAQSKGGGGPEYGLTPQYVTGADGSLGMVQLSKDGTAKTVELPEGVALQKGVEKLDLGTSYQWYNTVTAEPIGEPIPKDNRGAAYETAAGGAQGKADVTAGAEVAEMQRNLPGLMTVVDQLNGLADTATYTLGGQAKDYAAKQFGMEPGEGAIARAEYIAVVDNQVLPLLRQTFGAAFTAKEGDTLRATLGDPDKSPAEKKAVMNAFIAQKQRDLLARGGNVPGQSSGPSDDDLLKKYGGN